MKDNARKTKIIATVGPACENILIIGQLIEAGVDIFRFNLKYSTLEEHGRIIDMVRNIAISQNKNVKILIDLPLFSFTKGIDLAVNRKSEYVAISYLEKEDEIISFRKKINSAKLSTNIVAKIETNEALRHFNEILKEADSVMIARGDLGRSIPIEQVPCVQKEIISACQEKNKMVIVATEMLLSMTSNKLPTRAEVSDVANAVLEGSGAVMLSEETSIGENPVEAVKIMSKIICEAENWQKAGHLNIFCDKNQEFKFGE